MITHSFTLNGVDMRERFGLIAESFDDVLTPSLRPRKVVTPFRDGAYDYGAEHYDERVLTIHCASPILSREDCRALSLSISEKSDIVRWDEPDKHYVGRVYDPAEIERIAGRAKRFSIPFVCEPFAYGAQRTEKFINRSPLAYMGTARTFPLITITNTNAFPINGLAITMREAVRR